MANKTEGGGGTPTLSRATRWIWRGWFLLQLAAMVFGYRLLHRWATDPHHPSVFLLVGAALLLWVGAGFVPALRAIAWMPLMLVLLPVNMRHMRFVGDVDVRPLDPADKLIADPCEELMGAYQAGLEREGFRSGGRYVIEGTFLIGTTRRPSRVVFEGYEHPTTHEGAAVMLDVSGSPTFVPMPTLRISEVLPDSMWVGVFNGDDPPMFPDTPDHRVLALPRCRDVRELYMTYRNMMAKFAPPGYRAHGPAPNGWPTAIADECRNTIQKWMDRGWIVPSGTPGESRLPFLMLLRASWGQTPPIVGIRRRLRRLRCRRLRVAWGV